MMDASTVAKREIHLNVMVLEDEPFILEDLGNRMSLALAELQPGEHPEVPQTGIPSVAVRHHVVRTDNLEEATQWVTSGKCDVFLADCKVKRTHASKKDTTSCIPLLRRIRADSAFVAVIGHTAFQEELEIVRRSRLAMETISKTERNSVQRLVESGRTAALAVGSYKKHLWDGFLTLQRAAKAESPIDRQSLLVESREIFAATSVPEFAPVEYRRAVATFVPLLLRVSAVPSERFGLRGISAELVDGLEPLITALTGPVFSFKTCAVPVFQRLEGLGYDVFMRVSDDED